MTDSEQPRRPLTYRDAGVDIDAADRALDRAKPLIRQTFSPGVVSDIGAFGSLFAIAPGDYEQPVLVSSCDSVGTKLKIAFMTGRHDTIGEDIVNHCVNDILVQGARPLFFMDYLGVGKLEGEVFHQVIEGLVRGCKRARCALIGGETAELPGFYAPGEYDLVGFVVGVVERARVITGEQVAEGDVLLGLGSSGLHTNGYSLARKALFEVAGRGPDDRVEQLGTTIGDELLRVHRCYAPSVLPVLDGTGVHGIAHITGGGIPDNLRRILPEACRAVVRRSAWPVPPIFELIRGIANTPDEDMFRTFNMGIGMILVVAAAQAGYIADHLARAGEACYHIGEIVRGQRAVEIR
ncbi:MAG: phosphoribosylformylglycinamidine cyclo-ligase [Armatimonadota bacterium]|nr:MAG: phosphoribosylformylglycinamidine cyclo-ligase [Armatimonadota bacterium]